MKFNVITAEQEEELRALYPPVDGDLVGVDSNAFGVMGYVSKTLRRAGWKKEHIDLVIKEMTSDDYDHLLGTAMNFVMAEG